jgi:hypothetical protein
MIIVIDNLNYGFHFEIIESIIQKYNIILKINKNNENKIYLENINSNEYIHYINKIYPFIKINQKLDNYDYKIFSTFYFKELDKYSTQINNLTKYFFICHEVNDNLKKYSNVFYLTPLCKSNNFIYADVLPKLNQKSTKNNIPIYIVQGRIGTLRRNPTLLYHILNHSYNYNYKIKIIGRGDLPKILEPFKDKIIFKKDLSFEDYHNEFNDAYCILPLITQKSHPQYYTDKLTSSISYAKAYNCKCLIDKDLQEIYQLNNVEVFNNENDITNAFMKTLKDFYDNK